MNHEADVAARFPDIADLRAELRAHTAALNAAAKSSDRLATAIEQAAPPRWTCVVDRLALDAVIVVAAWLVQLAVYRWLRGVAK
jgi:hypothetical protein